MAGTPPVNPQTGHPADDSGARGVGGGRVDPPHEMHYMGKWPFGPPNNPKPDATYADGVELHVQAPSGGGQFDNIHPFKLQFFIDRDQESETFGEERLRIYTGMLTAMINSFEYDENSDTVNTYTLDVSDCTGGLCSEESCSEESSSEESSSEESTSEESTSDESGMSDMEDASTSEESSSGSSSSCEHSHTITITDGDHTHGDGGHEHDLPEHEHKLKGYVSLNGPVSEEVDKFLTVGSQKAIHGMLQIEPEGFTNLTNNLGQELEYRAQTLPENETYGKVYLTWDLDTTNVPPADKDAIEDVVQNVRIHVEPHAEEGDPADTADPADTDAGALDVKDNEWKAEREEPKLGKYYLHIGTTYDTSLEPDEDTEVEDINIKKIVQVIYENVYYSPFILPEKS